MYKAKFSIDEIIEAIKPVEVQNKEIVSGKYSISTDSRNLSENDIFLALKGENFNGSDFVEDAFAVGVRIFIVNIENKQEFQQLKASIIYVNDTLEAYLKIASFHRLRQKAKIVAITGSSGKTTTKEMVAAVLSSKYNVTKSIKNHNNEIGMANTLLNISDDCEYCVTEFGMRGFGEIELLTKVAKPDIGIITNVGPAHIGRLGSLENIAKAKCELSNFSDKNLELFIYDEQLIKENITDYNEKNITTYSSDEITIIKQDEEKSIFVYEGYEYKINETADFNILNALVAIKIGLTENIEPNLIQKGLDSYKNVEMRGEITKLSNGATLITDCYNANPDSVVSSLKSTSKTYKNRNIIVVFGDMLELGEYEEYYHKQIGKLVDELNVNYFVCCGKLAKIAFEEAKIQNKKYFSSPDEISDFLLSISDENSLILLKASRGMRFETIQKRLIEK